MTAGRTRLDSIRTGIDSIKHQTGQHKKITELTAERQDLDSGLYHRIVQLA